MDVGSVLGETTQTQWQFQVAVDMIAPLSAGEYWERDKGNSRDCLY